MAYPLKTVTQNQIEEAIAKALGELTGAQFTVSIRKIEAGQNNLLVDRNTIELAAESNYSHSFHSARKKRAHETAAQ